MAGKYSFEARDDHGYEGDGEPPVHYMIDYATDDGEHTVIGEGADAEKASFLATAANAYSDFDYMSEADKTCSIVFAPQYVDRDDLVSMLEEAASVADRLNRVKKLLFRGKTRDDFGLHALALHASLAVEFDPNNTASPDVDVLHGIVGVITEAGEMAEVLLHRIRTGEFDRVNAFEEVGDVSWYLARQLRGMNADFDMSNRANIDKLHGRHGAAFDVFRDANRDLAAERQRLETGAPLFGGNDAADGIGTVRPDYGLNKVDRETSDDLSSLASAALRDKDASPRERSLAGSVLSQDTTPGRRGALPPHVGIPKPRTDPPGVAIALKGNAGDCEGMGC